MRSPYIAKAVKMILTFIHLESCDILLREEKRLPKQPNLIFIFVLKYVYFIFNSIKFQR